MAQMHSVGPWECFPLLSATFVTPIAVGAVSVTAVVFVLFSEHFLILSGSVRGFRAPSVCCFGPSLVPATYLRTSGSFSEEWC